MKIHDFTFAFNGINGSYINGGGVCYIVAAGMMSDVDKNVLKACEFHDNDLIIAADGGIVYFFECFDMKVPDVFIGDFDSADINAFISSQRLSSTEIIKFPVEKDDTDMMLAIKKGFDRGYKDFVIFGGLEGAFYHTVSNLQSMKYVAEKGGRCYSVGSGAISVSYSGECLSILKSSPETYKFSVFSLNEKSYGVSIKGGKYGLLDAEIDNCFPLGAGNYRNYGEEVIIECKEGTILTVFNIIGD